MAARIVQIITTNEQYDQIHALISNFNAIESWEITDRSKRSVIFSIVLPLEITQAFLDVLQNKTNKKSIKKIVVSTVEAIIPSQESLQPLKPSKSKAANEAQHVPRDELYNQLANNVKFNADFIFLTLLSTIVAALGLLQNHIIAVIAAMVIAPMLEPYLALSLAAVLGDKKLLLQSVKTILVGIFVCLILSIMIGFFWPYGIKSSELLFQRSNVGYTSIVLALASGTAGAISLTSRFSSVLVGVMVAVALLPPLVAAGILLGFGDYQHSIGAGLLFIVNIVCVSLTSNLVFLFKGIHPQKWFEKKKAKIAIFWYLLFWVFMLLSLCATLYFKQSFL